MVVILLILLALLPALFLYYKFTYWRRKQVVYEPTYSPFGNLSQHVRGKFSMADLLENIYNKYWDEPFVGMLTFLTPTLLIRDLALIKEICVKNLETFATHKLFSTNDMSHAFSNNLFVTTGSKWKSVRPSLSPAFSRSKMSKMLTLVDLCAQNWIDTLDKTNDEFELNVKEDIFNRYGTDVIATCIFGLDNNSFTDLNNEFYKRSVDVSNFGGSKIFSLFGYCFHKLIGRFFNLRVIPAEDDKFFHQLVLDVISMRKEGVTRPDMVHMLMEAQKGRLKHEVESVSGDTGYSTAESSTYDKSTTKHVITDLDIVGHLLLFLIAGSDTPACVLTFLSFELANNHDIQEKLYEEIKEAMIECKGNIDFDVIFKMKYLDMVISEALRKWPPLPVTDRVVNKPYTLECAGKKVRLDVGDIVWIPLFSVHRDSNYWDAPDRFDPERFNEENCKTINKDAYMPFGNGPRSCLGSRLALMVMKTVIIKMLYNFEMVTTSRTPKEAALDPIHIFLNTKDEMIIGFKRRHH